MTRATLVDVLLDALLKFVRTINCLFLAHQQTVTPQSAASYLGLDKWTNVAKYDISLKSAGPDQPDAT